MVGMDEIAQGEGEEENMSRTCQVISFLQADSPEFTKGNLATQ